MEEVEVEILEHQDSSDKEFPILAELAVIRVPIQHVIVNGQEHIEYREAFALICPKCKKVIQQFNPGASEVDIVKSLCTNKEEELNYHVYCAKCGQKLSFMRPMPIDAEGTFSDENNQ